MEPYLFGCLLNFISEDVDSKFLITSDRCTYTHLSDIRDRLSQENFVVSKTTYTNKSSFFHCKLTEDLKKNKSKLLEMKATFSSREIHEIISGYIDTNSELTMENNDLKLQVYAWSFDILEWFQKVCGVVSEIIDRSLVIKFTNVLDILGKLPSCKKRTDMLFYQGINARQKCIFYKRNEKALIPSKFRYSDVGYDLSIISKYKDLNSVTTLWDTGIAIQIPFGYYAEIYPRSSLSKSGYMMANSVGIIDRSYRGNIYVALTKVTKDSLDIEENLPWKCCQIIFRKQNFIEFEEAKIEDEFTMTNRNAGGYGSTSS